MISIFSFYPSREYVQADRECRLCYLCFGGDSTEVLVKLKPLLCRIAGKLDALKAKLSRAQAEVAPSSSRKIDKENLGPVLDEFSLFLLYSN
jgi:hypothetical protein